MLQDTFEQLPTSIDTFTARHRHAAGIYVHKMQATVTLLDRQRDGHSDATTKTFSTLPSGQDALVAWLTERRVDAVVMESTGVYWKATYEALEAAKIPTRLVNAQHVKQLKGRKTDISDSQWLARVCQFEAAPRFSRVAAAQPTSSQADQPTQFRDPSRPQAARWLRHPRLSTSTLNVQLISQ